MGLFLRKALRAGPLRFNLSKSGVGLSVGVTGLRFGVGPRGRYVHAGRGGVYYRKTLPSGKQRRSSGRAAGAGESGGAVAGGRTYDRPEQQLREVESAEATLIQDSSSAELLEDIRARRRRLPLAKTVLIAAALIPALLGAAGSLALLLLLPVAVLVDRGRRKTVLFYELDTELQTAVDQLYRAFDALGECKALWHIPHAETPEGGRYTRKSVPMRYGAPPFLKTNLDVPILPAGRQTLYFMPEQVFVTDPKGVGAVSYSELEVQEFLAREQEHETVPEDARIIEWRWKHETKSGDRDRRYKNNYKLPTVEYRRILFSSPSGLRELFQASAADTTECITDALRLVIGAISDTGDSKPGV